MTERKASVRVAYCRYPPGCLWCGDSHHHRECRCKENPVLLAAADSHSQPSCQCSPERKNPSRECLLLPLRRTLSVSAIEVLGFVSKSGSECTSWLLCTNCIPVTISVLPSARHSLFSIISRYPELQAVSNPINPRCRACWERG